MASKGCRTMSARPQTQGPCIITLFISSALLLNSLRQTRNIVFKLPYGNKLVNYYYNVSNKLVPTLTNLKKGTHKFI
jgi:hypothetical protein